MDPLLLVGIATALAAIAAVFFFLRMKNAETREVQSRAELTTQLDQALSDLRSARQEAQDANAAKLVKAEAAAAADATVKGAERRIEELTREVKTAQEARDEAVRQKTEAEQQAALSAQATAEMQRRMDDWETAKKQSQEAANAAMLETATKLSTKLLEDHKRETDAAKKESEEKVQRAKDEFANHVQTIANTVATLHTLVTENRATVDTVVRALSTPAAAGQSAEIGLENTLKSFGLERGRDFLMQHSIADADARKLRPDAVVFLPSESVLVVDSKASKYVLEMAAAEGTEGEETAYANFANTMNVHLRALADKDYRSAIVETYRRAGRQGDIRRVISVMYVPQDSALERLKRADPEFARRASDNQIIPVGPAGLACMIGFARVEIDTGRQIENQEKIVAASQQLLDALSTALGHAMSVGNSIKGAAEHFAKFAASVNQRLLPRARALPQLGVRATKQLPANLAAIQVVGLEAQTTIEAEASDEEAMRLPSPKL
jgi:DNA recombination protein RmuC